MSPRHFAAYAKNDPKGYNQFTDNMWNGFVSITKHVPIVNRFFSFTPDFLGDSIDCEDLDAGQALGEALGQVYKFSQGIEVNSSDTKSL